MRTIMQVMGLFAILAVPVIALPAHAETQGAGTPGEWRERPTEAVDMNMERQSLEAEHDRIKLQCMDAKGQDRSACGERMAALRDKMMALHEERAEMHPKWKEEHHKTSVTTDDSKKHHKGKMKAKAQKKKPAPATPAPDSSQE
jgi:hypothetical protein